MNELIVIKQLPIIEEHLKSMQESVNRRVSEAMSLACTPETLTDVKRVRAELNKEFEDLEKRRKEVKRSIMEPYERFESVYGECISAGYKMAVKHLGEKISETESTIKSECLSRLKDYFNEVCALEQVEWLEFERMGLLVDLTTAKQKTPKKAMEQIKSFVSGVSKDVSAIDHLADRDEIMVEYRKHLDFARAVSTVQTRKRLIEKEAEASRQREAHQEAQRAAVERVQAVAPPVNTHAPQMQPRESESITLSFTVTGTKEQLIALREYMKKEGIKYE